MHKRRAFLIPIFIIVVLAGIGAWYWFQKNGAEQDNTLKASGTVEAVEATVSTEIAGSIVEVFMQKGDQVKAGDIAFKLDDTLLQSQRQRAVTALESARAAQDTTRVSLDLARASLESATAALNTTQVGVEAADVQLEAAIKAARAAEAPARAVAWEKDIPSEFDQPVWYFTEDENMAAAEKELVTTQEVLEAEQAAFKTLQEDPSNSGLFEAEERLAEAQAAFLVAQDTLDRANDQPDEELRDYAQGIFDVAETELTAAQSSYDQLLSDEEYADVLEARARLSVAQERYEIAQDRLDQMKTGDDSLQVKAARVALEQANAQVTQAEAAVKQSEVGVTSAESRLAQAQASVQQAQAELDLIDVQLGKLAVKVATSGVVLTRNIEPGEVIQPGSIALVIGQLDKLTITVYIPEDRYGQVKLGQQAKITVDSFPDETFNGTVTRIADNAEFTPRNVQTEEGRRTTVFAVEVSVNDPQGKLKPGMPADVVFNLNW